MTSPRLRIALLSYRGNPHSGGQGVYINHISKALVDLGHQVEVLAGPPYPEVHPDVRLTKLDSLDLYRNEDPFRTPSRDEFRDWIDILEYSVMCTAGFPEPLTFSLRAARELIDRRSEFDIVHDNQCLGYGLLQVQRHIPVIATIHHPCSLDKKLEIGNTQGWKKQTSLRRWYGFTRMQGRVARKLPRLISVSEAAKSDVAREFGVASPAVNVIHNGVDVDLFRPLADVQRIPGRIVTTASADVPLKGLVFLIEALAKIRTEREADLVVVGKARTNGTVKAAIERFGLESAVRFEHGVDVERLVRLYAEAEVACVPSLYEGFSLPAIEAMACRVPLVATRAGALPEVVGDAGVLVPPRDAGALATAILELLRDKSQRVALAASGRRRVLDHFTWRAAAAATVDTYRKAIDAHR
ncbi:MAG TPA: glycosyltransferase family 4 protein [Actinomycetota bacterium]|nr:glycosyltransferase family 4 protein [Actinomycetota bacterium]